MVRNLGWGYYRSVNWISLERASIPGNKQFYSKLEANQNGENLTNRVQRRRQL